MPPSIRIVEVALNKILRKIWRLPPRSHSAIAHCVAQVDTISNLVFLRFQSFLSKATSSSSRLISTIFTESTKRVNCSTGYNFQYGHSHTSDDDLWRADMIRCIRTTFGVPSQYENLVCCLSCD